ncbi:MAG TPA: ABC transporter permease, partial [Rhodospirillales bacterium]|nr:ABC transporter permease [Rhodospirillales bacterium]
MSDGMKPLPRWIDVGLIPAINVSIALGVSGLVIMVIGEDPWEAIKLMITGALG